VINKILVKLNKLSNPINIGVFIVSLAFFTFAITNIISHNFARANPEVSQVGCIASCNTQILDAPSAIAVDNLGLTYESDAGSYGIQAIYPDDGTVFRFSQPGSGAGQNENVGGIATDATDNVYVTDSGNNRILEFTLNGTFIKAFGWGVSDGANSFETCTTSCQAGIAGGGDGQLNYPQGIAVGPNGDIYVSDYDNNRVQEFDSSGNFIKTFGWGVSDGANSFEICTSNCQAASRVGAHDGQFRYPIAIAIDSGNNVYVGDTNNNRVQEFDSSGNFIKTFGWGVSDGANSFEICTSNCRVGMAGSGVGEFGHISGLATDSNINIYVSDSQENNVQEFDSSGNLVAQGGTAVCQGSLVSGDLCTPHGIAYNSTNDQLLVTNSINNNIASFDSGSLAAEGLIGTGYTQLGGSGSGQLNNAADISGDSNGNVYVTDTSNNRIEEFDSNGNLVKVFGWGVSDGASSFEICTSNCRAGIAGTGDGQFTDPTGINVDTSNDSVQNIYVVDAGNNRVEQFTQSGNFVNSFGWGVSDGASSFEICTSNCRAGIAGSGNGQFNYPDGIVSGHGGIIYVADEGNNRVEAFQTVDDDYYGQWGSSGAGNGLFNHPTDVLTFDGMIYVLDQGNDLIQVFAGYPSPVGTFDSQVNLSTDSFLDATGLAIGENGIAYVTDGYNDELGVFNISEDWNLKYTYDGVGEGGSSYVTNMPLAVTTINKEDADGEVDVLAGGTSILQLCDNANSDDNCNDYTTTTPPVNPPPTPPPNNSGNQTSDSSLFDPVSGNNAELQSTCATSSGVNISSPTSTDSGYSYPVGLMSYTLDCGTDGYTATVTQYFYGNYVAANYIERKYDPTTKTYETIPGAVLSNAEVNGQSALKIIYQITDGGPLDQDGIANGVIVDPSGPALKAAIVPSAPDTGFGVYMLRNHALYLLISISLVTIVVSSIPLYRDYRKRQLTKRL
jgi:DNA-binding beta-propeller fold protein YncE